VRPPLLLLCHPAPRIVARRTWYRVCVCVCIGAGQCACVCAAARRCGAGWVNVCVWVFVCVRARVCVRVRRAGVYPSMVARAGLRIPCPSPHRVEACLSRRYATARSRRARRHGAGRPPSPPCHPVAAPPGRRFRFRRRRPGVAFDARLPPRSDRRDGNFMRQRQGSDCGSRRDRNAVRERHGSDSFTQGSDFFRGPYNRGNNGRIHPPPQSSVTMAVTFPIKPNIGRVNAIGTLLWGGGARSSVWGKLFECFAKPGKLPSYCRHRF